MTRPVLPVLLLILAALPAAAPAQRIASKPLNLVPLSPGPAPADLVITGTASSATLTWPAVAGAMGYRVYRALAPATTWSLLTPDPVAQLRFDDVTGLDFRSQYVYRVAGVFRGGEGAVVERPFQPPSPLPVKSLSGPRGTNLITNLTIKTIDLRGIYPNGGSTADIFFVAVPNATTYTLKRGTSASGPYTDLTVPQVSWSLANYSATPPCCEVEDLEAYKAGASSTSWYVIDAWNGSTRIMSSAPIRFDLPPWFHGPLSMDVAKTGPNQWTLGWAAVSGGTGFTVFLRLNGGSITLYSGNLPATQTQVNVSGLVSGSTYQLYVAASVPWNGSVATVTGTKWYTAP